MVYLSYQKKKIVKFWLAELKNTGKRLDCLNIDWEKIRISRVSKSKIETRMTIPSSKIANALGVCIYKNFDLKGTGEYSFNKWNCIYNQYLLLIIYSQREEDFYD